MNNDFDYRKAVQAVNYFIQKEGGFINKMKALKLIWLSDRLHLRTYGRPVISDNYFAMPFGPVASQLKDILEDVTYKTDVHLNYSKNFIERVATHKIQSIKAVDENVFSKSDIEIMNKIYDEFGKFNQFELSEISHNYPEWKKFEEELKKGGGSYSMSYLDFFNDAENNDPIFNDDKEALQLSKEYFKTICD